MRNAQSDAHVDSTSESRWNVGRDVVAALFLAAALLLPWNVSFGVGVPDSSLWLFVLVVTVTVSASMALITTYTRQRGKRSASPATGAAGSARLALSVPYLLVVAGFLVYGVVAALRSGGTGEVPAGVGPGLLAGLAGALLAAQPPLHARGSGPWLGVIRPIGGVAAVLATVAVIANLYWRTRYPVQALFDGVLGGGNIAVIATTVVYAVTAWVTVLVGLRWSMTARPSSLLAATALGASTLLGAGLVWLLGVGRYIDAFHGIAQTTSTAAVGFEGYVAWAAIAAIAGPAVLRNALTSPMPVADWCQAVRMCLTFIAVWCAASASLRICDLIVAVSLDLPHSVYDSVALLAFDVVAAAAALWIRTNVNGSRLHPAVLSAGAGVLFVLTVCRVVVGVGLAPRILYSQEPDGLQDAVYGNMLAQQITSTVDIVLCWLALVVVGIAVLVLQRGQAAAPVGAAEHDDGAATETVVSMGGAPTTALPPVTTASTTAVPTTRVPTKAPPSIARTADGTTSKIADGGKPRIARVLEESTQRFGAGTTYTGTGPTRPPHQR